MGILSGNPKDEPMHYGEISNVWGSSTMAKGVISCYQAYLNHAGDSDLKKLIDDYIDQAKQEVKELDVLLQDNGIAPAPMMPDRPKVKLEDIPVGARFADQEIAAALSADSVGGLVFAAKRWPCAFVRISGRCSPSITRPKRSFPEGFSECSKKKDG